MWTPNEIIVHQQVRNDLVTLYFLSQCTGVPVTYVNSGNPKNIKAASQRLTAVAPTAAMLDKITTGKQVVYIGPAGNAVDVFTIPDDRLLCPHFERLKWASNGCFYQCDWCYLKGTFRGQAPFISVHVEYDKIKAQIQKRLCMSDMPILFNSGELADSLSLDHLTGAATEFIPWFAQQEKGYLFMLTKSDNVDHILNLDHNGHTIVAWSLNAPSVSAQYEIGAPSFDRRLEAARKVQDAGYRLRVRLDPIVPVQGWQGIYADTVQRIFQKISPERITLGTLRFEEEFHRMRHSIVLSNALLQEMEGMKPMFGKKMFKNRKRAKVGKHSYDDATRVNIFGFVIKEIRKHRPEIPVALCKESLFVWGALGPLGLDPSHCQCVCQLDWADMSQPQNGPPVGQDFQDRDGIDCHIKEGTITP